MFIGTRLCLSLRAALLKSHIQFESELSLAWVGRVISWIALVLLDKRVIHKVAPKVVTTHSTNSFVPDQKKVKFNPALKTRMRDKFAV